MVTSSQTTQGPGDDLESRFQHLIQPIRDLTKNWDVDIASQLEEYLDEIENIQITFDDGKTKMNFAEAALLIQGTACVYSKKVEYLYSLVYQVLDLLSSKKKLLKAASSVDADGNDKDAQVEVDTLEEFLSLDDLREHTNIDIRLHGKSRINSIMCTPKTPMSLVQFNEREDRGSDPLLSLKGEVLGSRSDYKMISSDIQATGLLLLDKSHLTIWNDTVFAATTTITTEGGTMLLNPERTLTGEDVPAVASDDDNDKTLVDDGIQNMSMESNHECPEMIAEADVAVDVEPRRSERQAEATRRQLVPKKRVDPWIMLDPHESDSLAEKPLKKGKTYNIPSSLELEKEAKKRKRKKSQPEKPIKTESVSEFCTKAYFSHASKFPTNPLKVPSFPEFERLYWIEFKKRQELQKKERKLLADQGRFEELAEEENGDNEVAEMQEEDDEDNNDFGLPEDDHEVNPPFDDIMERVMPMALDGDPTDGNLVVSSYEDLVRHHVEGFLAQSKEYAQISDLSRRISEWEEKIVPTLSEEDEREPFDIHKYGTMVLDCLGDSNKVTAFQEVAKNRAKFTVCRLFLATLQLANSYNVNISSKDGVEEAMDTMSLKLLSKKRHFEELEEYRAPSISS